ncbi:hypothetical protein F2P81_004587 [Scophthalmus maximus]|uniref:Uncharacterized protein n=1 Tax=Scophthalmus maximus TaxID=52904 RepID=A0A6A4THM8_SCOMX|nr:hypothetical protein F2P81_004587 [Scophthalmus maximus]
MMNWMLNTVTEETVCDWLPATCRRCDPQPAVRTDAVGFIDVIHALTRCRARGCSTSGGCLMRACPHGEDVVFISAPRMQASSGFVEKKNLNNADATLLWTIYSISVSITWIPWKNMGFCAIKQRHEKVLSSMNELQVFMTEYSLNLHQDSQCEKEF